MKKNMPNSAAVKLFKELKKLHVELVDNLEIIGGSCQRHTHHPGQPWVCDFQYEPEGDAILAQYDGQGNYTIKRMVRCDAATYFWKFVDEDCLPPGVVNAIKAIRMYVERVAV